LAGVQIKEDEKISKAVIYTESVEMTQEEELHFELESIKHGDQLLTGEK